MESKSYQDFGTILEKGKYLTVIFIQGKEKIAQQTTIVDLTDDYIHVVLDDDEHPLEIPKDQVLSVLYSSEHGLYGFHCKAAITVFDDHSIERISLKRPQSGWRIQRREHPRFTLEVPFEFSGIFEKQGHVEPEEQKHDALMNNIGRGGVCFLSNFSMDTGQVLSLDICLEGQDSFQADAVVVWAIEIPPEGRSKGFTHTYGARFVSVNEQNTKRLDHFIFKLLDL